MLSPRPEATGRVNVVRQRQQAGEKLRGQDVNPTTHVVRNVLDAVLTTRLDPNAEPVEVLLEALKLDAMKTERLTAIADTTNDPSNKDIKAVTNAATALFNCLFEGRLGISR